MAKNSIADHPFLLKEWDFENNQNLDPLVDSFSGRTKLWWKCNNGHSWESILQNRMNGSGCPFCSGQKVLKGFNDLYTFEKKLVDEEWDYDLNSVSPFEVGFKSSRKVWWKCLNGKHKHSYESTPSSRKRGRGCPYCSNKKVLVGFNDLAYISPEIALEWDYERNSISPQDITHGSDKRFWWNCRKGHSYEMSAYKRSIGQGCSFCASKEVDDSNNLLKQFPNIAQMWDFEKNTIDINSVTWGSNKKVWWIGKDCGHSFERSVKFMTKRSTSCPFCSQSNTKLLQGFNDLQTKFPKIAQEFNEIKNGFSAFEITSGSARKVWWKCSKGHEWIAVVVNRTSLNSSCPDCSLKGKSRQEDDFIDYIKSIVEDSFQIRARDRKLIYPYELDVYIPDMNIAFEYNGLYWHSEEAGKGKDYHYNKWLLCKEKNVQLIQIWEDDWLNKNSLVRSIVKHKLQLSNSRIYARSTIVEKINKPVAIDFLNNHHLQGNKIGCSYFGLRDSNNQLVAVLAFKKDKNNSIVIERFATHGSVVGGFSKLLKFLKKFCKENNIKRIVTFSDHDISNGGLYLKNGFNFIGESNGGYSYVVNGVREHRLNYTKAKFKNSDHLLYQDELNERELATLNGFLKIYDSGNDKFEMLL